MARAPQEAGYERQIGPGGAARLSGRSAESYGAGVGQQLEQLGGQLERSALQAKQLEYQRAYESDMAAGTKDVAAFQLEAREQAVKMETTSAPGGAGHSDAYRQWYSDRSKQVLDGIKNPRVRQSMDVNVAQDAATMTLRADGFEVGRRVAQWGQNVSEVVKTYGGIARRPESTRETVTQHIAAAHDMIFAGPGSDEDKRKAAGEAADLIARSFVDGRDPAAAKLELSDGYWTGTIDPAAEGVLNDRADSGIIREENRKRAAAAQVVSTQREAWSTTTAKVSAGEMVDPAIIQGQIVEATNAGDTSKAVELKRAYNTSLVTRSLSKATPMQVTAEIAKIEANPKWQEDGDLAMQHGALVELHTKLKNAVPNIPTPRDMNDPNAVAQWEQSLRAYARTRGLPEPKYIYGDLADSLEPLMKSENGKRQALEYISHMSDPAAFSAARELAPDDPIFQVAATMQNQRGRDLAMTGRQIMTEKRPSDEAPMTDVMHDELEQIGTAMQYVQPGLAYATKQTAVAIAQGLMREAGDGRYTEAIGQEAVRLALDGGMRNGRQKLGGLHEVDDHMVVLPNDLTGDEFDARYWRRAGTSPAMAAGEWLTWDQLRNNYRLVSVGDGLYQWRDAAGRPVLDGRTIGEGKVPQPLPFDVRKVSPEPVGAPRAVKQGLRNLKRGGFQ